MTAGTEVREQPVTDLATYARIPIAFEVRTIYEVTGLPGNWALRERPLQHPYIKDYDVLRGQRPTDWPQRFDLSRWAMLVARHGGELTGGAIIALDTPGVEMLRGRRNLAVLWDIRVAPEFRRQRIGATLFRAAEDLARRRGCLTLEVETQTVNVPACKLYTECGCILSAVDASAYPELPGETQLIWSKDLRA